MPIVSHPHEFNEHDLFVDLRSTFGRSLLPEVRGVQLRRLDQAEGRY